MDLLNRVLQQILGSNPSLKQGVTEARILELWGESVGTQIAKHSKAVQVRDSILFLSVDHPIWKQELHANTRLAITKLNEKLVSELGSPPAPKENWIEDLFLMSPNPINESPSKGKLKFRKK